MSVTGKEGNITESDAAGSEKARYGDRFKEMGSVPFPIEEINEAVENSNIYSDFTLQNEDDKFLYLSVRDKGILQPLQISTDGTLLSGHRRLYAARHVGLEHVPVIIEAVQWKGLSNQDRVKLLSEYNQQREKDFNERLRESLAKTDPEAAYRHIKQCRVMRENEQEQFSVIEMGVRRSRAKITTQHFADAVKKLVHSVRDQWTIGQRNIHYWLLNDPPLTHDSKPGSHYQNTKQDSKKLSSLVTRLRLNGQIPMRAICDDTRTTRRWQTFDTVDSYIHAEVNELFNGYFGPLQRGQPDHPEQAAALLLRTLYSPEEPIFCGNTFCEGKDRIQTAHAHAESFLSGDPIPPLMIGNPLTGEEGYTKGGKKSFRADSCVADYRYALFECDLPEITLETQAGFLWGRIKAGWPVVSITYSGGKSLHALLRVDAENQREWDELVKGQLFQILARFGADPACKTAARLTQMPGHLRADKGRMQQLLWLQRPEAKY